MSISVCSVSGLVILLIVEEQENKKINSQRFTKLAKGGALIEIETRGSHHSDSDKYRIIKVLPTSSTEKDQVPGYGPRLAGFLLTSQSGEVIGGSMPGLQFIRWQLQMYAIPDGSVLCVPVCPCVRGAGATCLQCLRRLEKGIRSPWSWSYRKLRVILHGC